MDKEKEVRLKQKSFPKETQGQKGSKFIIFQERLGIKYVEKLYISFCGYICVCTEGG